MAKRKIKRPVGRPAFKPTRPMRLSVERMLACGDSQNMVARALGIDDDTLRKHFAEEIATRAAKRRREVVDAVFEGVGAKNASLIRKAEEMTRAAAAQESVRRAGEGRPEAPRVDRRGKKEIQREEAATAGEGSEWGDDLKPLRGTPLN